jgi:hypothetical protein
MCWRKVRPISIQNWNTPGCITSVPRGKRPDFSTLIKGIVRMSKTLPFGAAAFAALLLGLANMSTAAADATSVFVGLAVTSHQAGTLGTAIFDHATGPAADAPFKIF